ncbi:MAG: ribulose-phosphate 3-epimerase [Candidatus Omnitrophica bacterium]|nr:ribulose-phosphate 3-epimerase [Candidatus Omnitrophota bacterium]
MKVVPAILTDDPKDLEIKIRQAESFSDIAQIDIMDGKFVPSRSVTADALASIKTGLFLEVHLMVDYPLKEIIPFKKAGVKRIIFHYEAKDDSQQVIRSIRKEKIEVGLAINPETDLVKIENLLDKIDILLIMAVNPGFYGSKFIPEVLKKSYLLHSRKRSYYIGLDGGIKVDNIRIVKSAGVDIAYVGSGIFGSGVPKDNFLLLLEEIKDV